jgi:lipoprotein NlpD
LVMILSAAACSRQIHHRVRPGENLYRIGKAYGVSVERLARANRLRDPSLIRAGQRLLIPGARRELPVDVITPTKVSRRVPASDEISVGNGSRPFSWPVASGQLSSGFGPRGRSFHDGIDIAAPVGTPVVAAAAGEVIYSDTLPGYGNVIIVRHQRGYATVYAHNQENRVHNGARVGRGQRIGSVGETGRTTGPNLHFEIRRDNIARNPLYYLPPLLVTDAKD